MKVFKTFLIVGLFFTAITCVYSQGKIDYMQFPKHAVSVAPSNIFFDGNGNTMFYKYRLSQTDKKLKYLRLGTEFYGIFRSSGDPESQSMSVNVGIETMRKMGRFSLYYGYEVAGVVHRANNRRIEPNANSIFSPQSAIGYSSNEGVDNSYFFLFSGIGVIGVKYHLAPQLSIGLESAAGFGFFTARQQFEDDSISNTRGILGDIDPSRQFNIEYYF